MRAYGLVLAAVICSVLGPASIRSSQAQNPDWFALSVCNKSSIKGVVIAIAHRNDQAGNNERVVGWFDVPDGGCVDMGTYWRDRVLVFAFAPATGDYWLGDASECVSATNFERIYNAAHPCAQNEYAVGFSELVAAPNQSGIQYTLN